MFRKPTKKRAEASVPQKRTVVDDEESDSDEEEDDAIVKHGRKRTSVNPMRQTTLKAPKTDDKAAAAAKASDEDSSESDDATPAPQFEFAASMKAGPSGPKDGGATYSDQRDTDITRDAQAQFERVQKQLRQDVDDVASLRDKMMKEKGYVDEDLLKTWESDLAKKKASVYRGSALYGAKIKEDTHKGSAANPLNRVGPARTTQFMRAAVRWDFAPDLCKDYKETGFCTFGDSCKFLHDRTDYKHGWEIERDWQAAQTAPDTTDYEIHDEDKTDDTPPDQCPICNDTFKPPVVVTKCQHQFCNDCALANYRKTKKCFVCSTNTFGVFNVVPSTRKSKDDVGLKNEPSSSYEIIDE